MVGRLLLLEQKPTVPRWVKQKEVGICRLRVMGCLLYYLFLFELLLCRAVTMQEGVNKILLLSIRTGR